MSRCDLILSVDWTWPAVSGLTLGLAGSHLSAVIDAGSPFPGRCLYFFMLKTKCAHAHLSPGTYLGNNMLFLFLPRPALRGLTSIHTNSSTVKLDLSTR